MPTTPEVLTPLAGGQLDPRIDLPAPDLSPEAVGVGPTQARADAISDYEHRRNVRRAHIMGVHYSQQICNGDASFNTGSTAAPNEYSRGVNESPEAWDDRLMKADYEDILDRQSDGTNWSSQQYSKLYNAVQNDPTNCNIDVRKFMGAYEDPKYEDNIHYGAYAGNRAFHWRVIVDPDSTFAERFAAAASDDALPAGEPGGRYQGKQGNIVFSEAQPVPGAFSNYKAAPTAVSEPVSVANGEYLETWRDFLIPGPLCFNGARYMGLKMALPMRWHNPLGMCQISAFDELISAPKFGKLEFHQADGKKITFDRPFNFLPSIDGAYPHLELRAPDFGKLRLKDRTLVKYFVEYDDRFYRLERVEDLNGNFLQFRRNEEGILEKIENSNGLALVFTNDRRGLRTAIILIGTDGSRVALARYTYDDRRRMVSAECSFGMSVRYYWHETKPLLLRWHNIPGRSETVFTYDDNGRVVHTATNGIWNDDRFQYDSEKRQTTYIPGNLSELTQRFDYDENENITAEIDALGGVVCHVFDKAGFRISTIDANGHSDRTAYDSRGNVREFVDAEGRKTVYGWGPNGELDVLIDNAGNVSKFENDGAGNVIVARDAEGHEIRFERDAHGCVVKTIFANGSQEQRAYDAYGRLAVVKYAQGGITRFSYDAFGRLISTHDADEKVTTLAYSVSAGGFATPTSLTRADGVTVTRAFDGEGTLAKVTDGEGRTWTYEYGAFDVPRAIIDPQGGRLAFSHDNEGRLTAVGNARGQIWQFVRDVAGRVIREEDFDGRRIFYSYDPSGRVIETRQEDGARSTFQYDKTGLLLREESFGPNAKAKGDAPEDITRYWYDGRGLLEKAENNSALVEYERDKNGRIISETVNGRRAEGRLDAMGNRIERRIAHNLVKTVRDPLGLVAEIIIGDHAPLAFTRDALGRETRRESGTGFYLAQGFDAAGQLINQSAGFSIASLGKGIDGLMQAQQLGISPRPVLERAFSWDKAFSPLGIKDNSWGETAYQYDGNGQVVQAANGDGSGERFRYDAAHNIAGFAQGAGPAPKAQTRSYDDGACYVPPDSSGVGFMLWHSSPGGKVKQATGPFGERVFLTHDNRGRVTERRVERDGFRSRRWLYTWDAKDRLIACKTPEQETWRYGYDPFGRRVWKVKQFTEAEARSYTLSYPHLIDPKRIPDRGAHYLPAERSRLDRDRRGESGRPPIVGVHYSWDGDVLAEEAPLRLDGSVEWDQATTWHYEPGTFRPLAKQTPDGKLLYIITDHLGTPREMFDEQGKKQWAAEYRLWGDMRQLWKAEPANDNIEAGKVWNPNPSGPRGGGGGGRTFGALALNDDEEFVALKAECPIRFLGQWEDQESGLFYNRHRYYDPLAGQYLCPDPIGLKGGARPQGYVENPCSWVDSLGLDSTFWAAKDVNGRRIYQRDDLITPDTKSSWVDPLTGNWKRGTNVQRMQDGLAPIGPDGKSINLHHSIQVEPGPMVEMTQTMHQKNTKLIHINPNSMPSWRQTPGLEDGYNAWRSDYWKIRASDFIQ